jgi:hypothetical protein
VIVKALRCVFVECGFVVVACLSFVAQPLMGWCIPCGRWPYIPLHQDVLTMWYTTVEPCRVNVLHIKVHGLGRAKWYHRCYTSPAFGRVSIYLTSRGHLTLVVPPMARHAA